MSPNNDTWHERLLNLISSLPCDSKILQLIHDDRSSNIILSMLFLACFSVIFNRFYKQNRGVLEKLLMILGDL